MWWGREAVAERPLVERVDEQNLVLLDLRPLLDELSTLLRSSDRMTT